MRPIEQSAGEQVNTGGGGRKSVDDISHCPEHGPVSKAPSPVATPRKPKRQIPKTEITVDEHWTIARLDAHNWQIRKDGKFPGGHSNFYGTLIGAFQGLPLRLLDEGASGAVAAILARWRGICDKTEDALRHVPDNLED